jgi:hypothetical protein
LLLIRWGKRLQCSLKITKKSHLSSNLSFSF